jgi:Flp pilus assembly protein TadD
MTDRLGSRGPDGDVAQMSAAEAATATSQWATAYAKDPQNPKMALGYSRALKAIGSRDKALEVLTSAYQTNPSSGEVAAELGRLALDMGRLDIANTTLKVAEAQGVRDWKTLSAEGTLRAKQGKHAEAQQYYLAALQEKPDAVSVINNLALSYALDGKPKKSETLLRKAVASGHEDKRVRQNLALVLGLQGKFDEARQVASVDMNAAQTKDSMAYLRNMLAHSTAVASADSDDDWQPFGPDAPADAPSAPPVKTVAAKPAQAKVQIVAAAEEVKAPSLAGATAATPAPSVTPAWKTATHAAPAAPMPITPGGTTDRAKTATAKASGSSKADID